MFGMKGNGEMIELASYAKINLSLDVTGVLDSGMHQVDMVMQQISLHDSVAVEYEENAEREKGDIDISLKTSKSYLPADERNTAFKAALLMAEKYGSGIPGGTVRIDIVKRIPVAAGMAGGSGNGAAVLHALNVLWNLRLSLGELCSIGSEIGSDVPFCVMGQAACNFVLPKYLRKDALAASCARATGTGTDMEPVRGLKKFVVVAKPKISVSTGKVYQGIDSCAIGERPDNDALADALAASDYESACGNFINVLENYTLNAYPEVRVLKEKMKEISDGRPVLMSGSGPTVYGICDNLEQAKKNSDILRKQGYESYWTKTTR